jgi:PAP2 superfamily
MAVRALATRRLSLLGEMGLLVGFLAMWQVARVPLEGSMALSVAHAETWLSAERALHLDLEGALLRFAHHPGRFGALSWSYENLHLAALFAFMTLARLLAPDRYPRLRTAFLLAHLPALLVIGLYPLAPPRWTTALPFGSPAPLDWNGPWTNSTAAAASLHVGYPVFIAASTVWLARKRIAWLAFAYPALVFTIVVGTGNHYVLDAIVGCLAVGIGFAGAWLVHRGAEAPLHEARPPLAQALTTATGYGLTAGASSALIDGRLTFPEPVPATLLLAGPLLIAAAGFLARSPQSAALESAQEQVHTLRYWLGRAHSPKVEIAGALALYVLYELGRGLVADRLELAREHAEDVIRLEGSIHLLWERDIQDAVLRLPGLVDLLSAAYVSLHLGATLLLFVWLYRNHRAVFPIARTALILATALALFVHVIFPTAPPRLVGFTLDTVVDRTRINLNSELLGVLYNPIAAMPSMHFGYALLVGFMLAKLSRSRVMRVVGLLYVPLVLFVIVSTGNHFMLDAAAGAVVMAVGWWAATTMARGSRPAPEQPAGLHVGLR